MPSALRHDGRVISAPHSIRVLVVDDHALYRRGLQAVLSAEADIEVVAEADGVAALHQAEETLPDVVIMDVKMRNRGGIKTCRALKQRVPSVRILMLTGSDGEADLFEAVCSGASGYLYKGMSEDEIATGVRGVINGESPLSPMMATKLRCEFEQLRERPSVLAAEDAGLEPPRLTEREIDILQLVSRGRRTREIADELDMSENTVRNHVRNILEKLQVHSRLNAAMWAVRQRLVDPSG